MNTKAIGIFLAGAAAGSAIAWYFTKAKYKKIADEEIADVKEHFSVPKKPIDDITAILNAESDEEKKQYMNNTEREGKVRTPARVVEETENFEEGEDMNAQEKEDYNNIVKEYKKPDDVGGYVKFNANVEHSPTLQFEEDEMIFPIAFDNFGEFDDYRTGTLYYTKDGFLVYEEPDTLELAMDEGNMANVDDTVGWDSLDILEANPDEGLCVRNSEIKVDYEIIRSEIDLNEIREEHYASKYDRERR